MLKETELIQLLERDPNFDLLNLLKKNKLP